MTNIPSISDYGISARGFAEFFDGIPAAIYRTTLEGKLVYCNKAFAQIFGFDSAEELIGYPVIEFYRNKKDRIEGTVATFSNITGLRRAEKQILQLATAVKDSNDAVLLFDPTGRTEQLTCLLQLFAILCLVNKVPVNLR